MEKKNKEELAKEVKKLKRELKETKKVQTRGDPVVRIE